MGEEDCSSFPPGAGNALTGRMSRALYGGGLWPWDRAGGVGLPEGKDLLKRNYLFFWNQTRSLSPSDCFPHLLLFTMLRESAQKRGVRGSGTQMIIPVSPLVWLLPIWEVFLGNNKNNRRPLFSFGQGWKLSSRLCILAVKMESVNFTEN